MAQAEQKELEVRGTGMLDLINSIKVTSQEKFEIVAGINIDAKKGEEAVVAFFEPMRKTAKAAYDEVLKTKKEVLAPFAQVKQLSNDKMLAWNRKQEEIARQKAEKLKAKAEAAEEKGETFVAPPTPVARTHQVDGIVWIDNWKYEVQDLGLLVKRAAKDPKFLVYLQPEPQALRKAASIVKDQEHQIDGIRFFNDKYQKRSGTV